MAIGGVGGAIAWVGATTLLAFAKGNAFGAEAWLGLAIAFFGCLAWGAVAYWRGRRRRGDLIFDCGPISGRLRMIGVAAGIIVYSDKWQMTMGAIGPFFSVGIAMFFLVMACGRFKVYERGLWIYRGLLEWDRIGSFEWSEKGDKLFIRGNGQKKWNRSEIPVEPPFREAIARCLEAHISVSRAEPMHP